MNAAGESRRSVGIDVLRGVDMFWIVGGREIALSLSTAAGATATTAWLDRQLHHAEWTGFTAWDLVFPLFLFLSGVSLPFSLAARRARGATDAALVRHAVQRGLLLVLLGAIYNGLLGFHFADLRYASVLGRIGIAGAIASCIAIRTEGSRTLQVGIALLVAYGLLLVVPVGDAELGSLERGRNVVDWFDQHFLPGRLHREVHDPEGWLGVIPASVSALAGVVAGRFLRQRRTGRSAFLPLAGSGAVVATAGLLLGFVQPISKALWTPAFTLLTAGISLVLLAVACEVFDGPSRAAGVARSLARPAVVIGQNPLTAYLAWHFLGFEALAKVLFQGAVERRLLPEAVAGPLGGFVLLLVGLWLLGRTVGRIRL